MVEKVIFPKVETLKNHAEDRPDMEWTHCSGVIVMDTVPYET